MRGEGGWPHEHAPFQRHGAGRVTPQAGAVALAWGQKKGGGEGWRGWVCCVVGSAACEDVCETRAAATRPSRRCGRWPAARRRRGTGATPPAGGRTPAGAGEEGRDESTRRTAAASEGGTPSAATPRRRRRSRRAAARLGPQRAGRRVVVDHRHRVALPQAQAAHNETHAAPFVLRKGRSHEFKDQKGKEGAGGGGGARAARPARASPSSLAGRCPAPLRAKGRRRRRRGAGEARG